MVTKKVQLASVRDNGHLSSRPGASRDNVGLILDGLWAIGVKVIMVATPIVAEAFPGVDPLQKSMELRNVGSQFPTPFPISSLSNCRGRI